MDKLKKEFIRHCWFNNQEGVRDCLSRGVDVNTLNEYGNWSGLAISASENYPELLEIFLSHPQIKINIPSGLKRTALMDACDGGNSAIVSRLLQVPGIEINCQDKDGATAAHLACKTEIGRMLAETGRVDWNKGDKCGRTPLFSNLIFGNSAFVDFLVQQPHIDYNVRTTKGLTLAQAAVRGGLKCVETLSAQERCDCWNVPDMKGNTPIMEALKDGKTEIVEILLSCPRVDLNCRDKEGWSLLFRALENRKLGKKYMMIINHSS